MRTAACVTLLVGQLVACDGGPAVAPADRSTLAERFFRGVYGCDPAAVSDLAADSAVISYPIFEELFHTSAIRGREDVLDFAAGFCSRWNDADITVHEAIAEDDQVVLVWSFRARNVASGEQQSWGGITWFRFDGSGKVVAEIGEESAPGPIERMALGADST